MEITEEKRKSRRTVTITNASIARLRKIGGTLDRGIHLASFADNIDRLIRLAEEVAAKIKHCEEANQPTPGADENLEQVLNPALSAIKPLTALQKQNPVQVMAKRREQFVAWGFDPVIVEHADAETMEAMARQVAEGTAPAQLATLGKDAKDLLADWDEFGTEG